MKQQINFYTRLEPEKAAPKALLSIIVVSVTVILGYCGFALVLMIDNREGASNLVTAQLKDRALKQEISKRQAEDKALDLSHLENTLANLSMQHQRQELLLKYLKDPAFTNLTGFSDALTGLARQHVRGVSIEKFELTHRSRQFVMAGKVDHPTYLPRYIERLGSEAVFAQMSFEKVDISENDGELDFQISSLSQSGGDS